jgi:hypothetical protein
LRPARIAGGEAGDSLVLRCARPIPGEVDEVPVQHLRLGN